jgi:hypothetical protein
MKGVRNPERQRELIHPHHFECRKPPLERIGTEMKPDFAR